MRFIPDQFPGTILASELATNGVGPVVRAKAFLKIVAMAHIELAFRILEDVSPAHRVMFQD